MNFFAALIIVFLFFSKALLQDYPVWVTCGPDYFQVIMDRDLFQNGVILNPQQVILGEDCQVSTVLEDKFFFFYSVFQCGIQSEMKWNMITFHSVLHCISLDHIEGGNHDIPVKCTLDKEIPKRPLITNFPPPSVGVSGVNDSSHRQLFGSFAPRTLQNIGHREGQSGPQDLGASTLAWNAFPVPTLSLVYPVS